MTETPFDSDQLDRLLEEAGIDILLTSSVHNLRYLLGHDPIFFFEYAEPFGTSKYQPILVYPRGRPDQSFYAGFAGEGAWRDHTLWVPNTKFGTFGTRDAMGQAVEFMEGVSPKAVIGIESPLLSADALTVLKDGLPDADVRDATGVLQELRARKTPEELACIRRATEGVLDSIVAVLTSIEPGMTKFDVSKALAREEASRDLTFKYCLVAAGSDPNRAPSSQRVEAGDIVSIDSGGTFAGYLGDIARMGVVGEPDAELEELLAEVDHLQELACAVVRPGALGREISEAVAPMISSSEYTDQIVFEVHGVGLVGHEVPNLMNVGTSVVATDGDRPLEEGMMVSIETALVHPQRGFIKMEDAVAVTADGHDIYAPGKREWHRGAASLDAAAPVGHGSAA